MDRPPLFIFDLGGVLFSNNVVIPSIADVLGTSTDILLSRLNPALMDLLTGSIAVEGFWALADATFPGHPHDNLWSTLYHPTQDECVASVLADLRGRGHRVVAGTNTIDDHYRYHACRGEFDLFDTVYASHIMGLAKPDPAFYQHILRSEERSPAESVFIDDKVENVDAARKLGFKALRFTDCSTLRRDLTSQIDLGTRTERDPGASGTPGRNSSDHGTRNGSLPP
jgi:glucose-1-phosphatase